MILVEDLWKTYVKTKRKFFLLPVGEERVEALRGVSFEVGRGEVVGYLGPNGSGKSTTIKILAGVLYPDRGRVEVAGFLPWKREKDFLKRIGVMFGHRSFLFWEIPVIDTFLFYKEAYGLGREEFDDRLARLSTVLDIKDYLSKPARELSLGERVRCELALALLHDPDVLLLDEPFLGIDVWSREKIRVFLREIAREGKAVLLSSHQLEDVEEIADRVILLDRGNIVFEGTVDELKGQINWKRIRAVFSVPPPRLPYLVRKEGNVVELRVPRKEVKDVVKEVLQLDVIDLIVEEPRLEEVVRDVIAA